MSDWGKQAVSDWGEQAMPRIRASIRRPILAAMLLAFAALALEPELAPIAHAPTPTNGEGATLEDSHVGAWETGALERNTSAAATTTAATAVTITSAPQRRRFSRRGGGYDPPDVSGYYQNMEYNGRFTFSRVRFMPSQWWWGRQAFGIDLGWNHDYPRAEANLMRMVESLTMLDPNPGGGNIYELDEPDLFKYPWAYICEVGYWTLTDEEAKNLREFLLKGGFLVVDDMRGYDLTIFEENFQRVLPGAKLEILDTTHPIFNSFFKITREDILSQAYPMGVPVIFGVYEDNDPSKRLMVIINHNQDVGDSWEWSDTGYIPIELSNNAFKLGINYIVYAMSH